MKDQVTDLFPDGKPPWIDEGDLAARYILNDEWLVIRPMLFSLRLAVMTAYDASVEHWCFPTLPDALLAFTTYPYIPSGWTRHFQRDHKVVYP